MYKNLKFAASLTEAMRRAQQSLRGTGKQTLFSVLALGGARAWLERRIRNEGGVVVLNLHSVSPDHHPFWPALHPDAFDQLLSDLAYQVYFATFSEAEAATLRRPSRPVVVLSFDDGYTDFLEYAAPILRKHGAVANLNIITGAIASNALPWNVKLYERLQTCTDSQLAQLQLDGFDAAKALSSGGRTAFGLGIARLLKNRSTLSRQPALDALWQQLPEPPRRSRAMMTPADVRTVAASHELGFHSDSHASMRFESDAFFESDYAVGAARFLEWTGKLPTIYAFPNGSYRNSQIRWLKAQGVQHTLLVDETISRERDDSGYVWPRLTLRGESPAERYLESFGAKVQSAP